MLNIPLEHNVQATQQKKTFVNQAAPALEQDQCRDSLDGYFSPEHFGGTQ